MKWVLTMLGRMTRMSVLLVLLKHGTCHKRLMRVTVPHCGCHAASPTVANA